MPGISSLTVKYEMSSRKKQIIGLYRDRTVADLTSGRHSLVMEGGAKEVSPSRSIYSLHPTVGAPADFTKAFTHFCNFSSMGFAILLCSV